MLFAVAGAGKALEMGVGPVRAIILGAVTGVGGGTVRDVLIRQVPSVLSSGLYAIPALVGAALTVVAVETHRATPSDREHMPTGTAGDALDPPGCRSPYERPLGQSFGQSPNE